MTQKVRSEVRCETICCYHRIEKKEQHL